MKITSNLNNYISDAKKEELEQLTAKVSKNDIYDLDCEVTTSITDENKLECSLNTLACSIGCRCSFGK